MITLDFIALDFEIANRNYNSACSLGLVFVSENKIVDKKYFIIKPPTNNMDPAMTDVHGLTIDDVKDAPTFDSVWNEISQYFNNENYIIAHNAQFDMSVLKNCLITYDLEIPDFKYICNIPITTRACRREGIPNSLEARAARFGIKMEEHHNALSDAMTVAQLILTCIKLQGRKSFQTYLNTYSSIPIRNFKDLKYSTRFKGGNRFESVRVTEIVPEHDNFHKEHPVYDKVVVFTGELDATSRRDAMQQVVNLGGMIRTSVSRFTDYLIIGKQDLSIVGRDGKSSKERRVFELIEQGHNIQVLNEDEFLNLVNMNVHIK